MSRPHVMQVIGDLEVGGVERLAAVLAVRLGADGFTCSVCALGRDGRLGDELRGAGVPIFTLGRRPGLDLRVMRRLAAILREQEVDILHTHHTGALVYGVPAALVAGVRAVVHTEHSHDALDNNPRLRAAERVLTKFTTATTCVTQEVKQYLSERVRIPPRRLIVLPNGVDTEVFAPGPADPTLIRELRLSRCKVVGTVGRLDALKDQATLIRAFALVRSSVPDARLIIVGDGPLRAELADLAEALGVRDAVRFTGTRCDVPALLRAFDVFALSSTHEGLPLALLEAMSTGVAAVATAVGGVPNVVEHGVSGFLCTPKDADALAGYVVRLLGDADLRRTIGQDARARVEAAFSVRRMIEEYRGVYEAVLARRRGWTGPRV